MKLYNNSTLEHNKNNGMNNDDLYTYIEYNYRVI